jgi:hypothetical protein
MGGVVQFSVGRRLVAALLERVPDLDSSPFADVVWWIGAAWLEPVLRCFS